MCLLTMQICPIRARKPIVVYKVLLEQRYRLSEKRFITPWRYEKTELNRHLIAAGKKIAVQSGVKKYRAVGPGYIHCYTKIEYARWAREYQMRHLMAFEAVIVECIIEPGTRYYRSWDGEEIAADSIFIKEIVDI